jgi:hypothetical protein
MPLLLPDARRELVVKFGFIIKCEIVVGVRDEIWSTSSVESSETRIRKGKQI